MNNFIFKSASRLTKNSPISNANLYDKLLVMQSQLRLLRSDLVSVNGKLDRLLIDKHLQMQVDDYYRDQPETPPPSRDQADLD